MNSINLFPISILLMRKIVTKIQFKIENKILFQTLKAFPNAFKRGESEEKSISMEIIITIVL